MKSIAKLTCWALMAVWINGAMAAPTGTPPKKKKPSMTASRHDTKSIEQRMEREQQIRKKRVDKAKKEADAEKAREAAGQK